MKQLSNLPDKEFKLAVINMLTRFERKVDELSGNLNQDTEK